MFRGITSTAYKYIARNGGIDTEESYPYLGKVQKHNTFLILYFEST